MRLNVVYANYLEALRDDVDAIGGAKELGRKFWPEKNAVVAGRMVNDCLNPDRRCRFNDDQVRFIIRRSGEVRGFSAALYHLCDETGFELPEAKNLPAEIAAREQQFKDAVSDSRKITIQLEELNARLPSEIGDSSAELAGLQRQFIDSVKKIEQILERIER